MRGAATQALPLSIVEERQRTRCSHADAEKYFKKGMDLDPAFANSTQLFLAHIALAEHRDHDAEDYIRAFLELHPNSPEAPHLKATLAALVSGTLIHPAGGAKSQNK